MTVAVSKRTFNRQLLTVGEKLTSPSVTKLIINLEEILA